MEITAEETPPVTENDVMAIIGGALVRSHPEAWIWYYGPDRLELRLSVGQAFRIAVEELP